MKAVLIFCVISFLSGCAPSLKTKALQLMDGASIQNAPLNWRDRVWDIKVNEFYENKTYALKARFKENKFPYYSCLFRGKDDPWLELEILEWDDGIKVEKDLVALYVQHGAYIEILLSGDMCDHYDILMTKITENGIRGYITFQGWGHMEVYGLVNINKNENP